MSQIEQISAALKMHNPIVAEMAHPFLPQKLTLVSSGVNGSNYRTLYEALISWLPSGEQLIRADEMQPPVLVIGQLFPVGEQLTAIESWLDDLAKKFVSEDEITSRVDAELRKLLGESARFNVQSLAAPGVPDARAIRIFFDSEQEARTVHAKLAASLPIPKITTLVGSTQSPRLPENLMMLALIFEAAQLTEWLLSLA
jgi:hypothetical protein